MFSQFRDWLLEMSRLTVYMAEMFCPYLHILSLSLWPLMRLPFENTCKERMSARTLHTSRVCVGHWLPRVWCLCQITQNKLATDKQTSSPSITTHSKIYYLCISPPAIPVQCRMLPSARPLVPCPVFTYQHVMTSHVIIANLRWYGHGPVIFRLNM